MPFILLCGNMIAMSAYAALAEPHRRQILDLLRKGEKPAGDLVDHLGLSQPGVSKHLKVLREAGLVTAAKRGRWVDYALAEDASERMRAALPGALSGPVSCAPAELALSPVEARS